MPKESESFNKKDNSTSEMIVITPNPRVEEVLISDQDHIGREALTYEARLNEKLKDLDLYEDDMTIQQKEELLEVVVASWETAEKEKTRRQFFQDYMNASEAFCNDQYEFTLQESDEIHNAIRCTDIPLPSETSNASAYSSSFQSSSTKVNGNLSLQYDGKDISSESALKMSMKEKVPIKSANELQSYDTSRNRDTKSKCRPPRRGRSRRGRGAVSTHSAIASTKRTDTQEATDVQPSLEKSISSWRPCLSPKETPLTCSRRPLPEEKDVCSSYSEEEYSKKVFEVVKEFDYARKEMRKSCPMQQAYSKPYHLTRRGLFVKKAGKPDKYDTMIGVTELSKNDPSLSETPFGPHLMVKGEPFSRTSEGAHRYIKSNRSEAALSCTNTPIQMTRSGTRYGFQRTETHVTPDDKSQVPKSEIVTDSSCRSDISSADVHSKQSSFPATTTSAVQMSHEKDVFNELLPKFNHLRTSVCEEVAVISNGSFGKTKSRSKSPVSTKTKNSSSSASSESQNHIVNSSCIDSDSSDSSVIDVETVVDDEINEFVLKRKMLQAYPSIDKEQSQSKRLKKGAS